MKIVLKKSSGRARCRHHNCQNKLEFINDKGRIKKGTTCALIVIPMMASAYYCRDCIDQIYSDVRKVLNPKLWIFH